MFDLGATLQAEGFDSQEVQAIADVVKVATDALIENYRIVGKEGLSSIKTEAIVQPVKRRTISVKSFRRDTSSPKSTASVACWTMASVLMLDKPSFPTIR